MTKAGIATGVVHRAPADLREALISANTVRDAWNDPLHRSPVMNGLAGLHPSRSRRREETILSEYTRSY